jgi:uncharacterized protein (UPF0332 family)
MSFDWLQNLNLAKELAGVAPASADKEARYRAAIHLAYYGAFNFAKDYLENTEELSLPESSEIHQFVWQCFYRSQTPEERLVANKLRRLRLLRNQADYAAFFPGLASFAKIAIALAEEIVATIKSLIPQ